MEVKKLKSVNDFYSEVIVKDKKLTWKCPICFEECRFLDQHLKRKHSISFKDYFKSNVDYSCKYCGEFKKLSDLKWDRLKVSIHSLDHKDCIDNYKVSVKPQLYCNECGCLIVGSGKKYCSYTCSNLARYKDPLYLDKHKNSIRESYIKNPKLVETRAISAITTGFYKLSSDNLFHNTSLKGDTDFYLSRIKTKYNILNKTDNCLHNLHETGKSSTSKFNSSLERLYLYYLIERNIKCNYQFILDRFIFDFYLEDYNLIVELDGYYHNNKEDNIRNCIAIHKGYNIVRISNVFDGCIDYCLDSENWVKKSDLIDFDKVIESYYKGSIRKLKGKPKSSNLNDHWNFRSDITKELVDCFISDKNQKKTIRRLLNYLNVTNAKVIKRVAESFYNLTYYDFVERYLYESKIKKNN